MPKKTKSGVSLSFLSNSQWLAILIGIGYFIFNLPLLPAVNVGFADSDMLITVAHYNGIAHPPGYPLYMSLLHVFLKLPINAPSVAYQAHLFSLLMATFSLTVMYALIINVLQSIVSTGSKLIPYHRQLIPLIAALSTLSLGFTFIFWRYALVAEKYSFTTLLTAFALFTLFDQIRSKSHSWRQLAIAGGAYGCAVAHMQSLIFLLPLYGYIGYKSVATKPTNIRARTTSIALISTAIGFILPQLLLWRVLISQPHISWRFNGSLNDALHLITRQDFSGQVIGTAETVSAYFNGFNEEKTIAGLTQYLNIFLDQWGLVALLIVLFFIIRTKLIKHDAFKFSLAAFLLLGPVFIGLIGVPKDPGGIAITMRQFLIGYTAFPLIFALGLLAAYRKAFSVIKILSNRFVFPASLVIVILLGFPYGISRYQYADLSDYTVFNDRYAGILASLPDQAILTCHSDFSCFAFLYEQFVENNRSDVQLIPSVYPLMSESVFPASLQTFPNYSNNPFLTIDIISTNIDKRPIASVEITQTYVDLLGFEAPFMHYIPESSFVNLRLQAPSTFTSVAYPLHDTWLTIPITSFDPMLTAHREVVATDHMRNGRYFMLKDQRNLAIEEFNRASALIKRDTKELEAEFESVRSDFEFLLPSEFHFKSRAVPTSEELLSFAYQYLEAGRYKFARAFAQAAVFRDLQNLDAKLFMAQLYEQVGDVPFAIRELENALILKPDLSTASAKLESLRFQQNR